MHVPVVASTAHRRHETMEYARGRLARSPESPERAEIITDALRAAGHPIVEPNAAGLDVDSVGRVHTPQYLDFLASAWDRWIDLLGPSAAESGAVAFTWPRRGEFTTRPDDVVGQLGYHSFAGDSPIVAGTWEAVSTSATIAQTAADHVLQRGDVDPTAVAYALCRPPGHHATADQLGGYCYLNHSAIAAQRLLDAGHRRVAILDVDYHHGNGTQSIFERRPEVLTISIHADTRTEFPWFSGGADETGLDAGVGSNLNLPLPLHATVEEWNDALDRAVTRISDAEGGWHDGRDRSDEGVDALVVALGVDTYAGDPLGTFALEVDDFRRLGQRIAELRLPTVLVQEGGYATEALGSNVGAVLAGIAG